MGREINLTQGASRRGPHTTGRNRAVGKESQQLVSPAERPQNRFCGPRRNGSARFTVEELVSQGRFPHRDTFF